MRWIQRFFLGVLVLLSVLQATSFVLSTERNCQHYTGCSKRATYGCAELKIPRFCAQHREYNHVDLNRKRCRHPEGCENFAVFTTSPSDSSVLFCKEHCNGNLLRPRGTECQHPECNVSASFGPDGNPPMFCKNHKNGSHVDVRHRKCHGRECWRRAYYGLLGASAAHCRQHRKEGEIDLSSRRCQAEEGGPCLHQPNFGSPSDGKKRFCSKHKRKLDVDLRFMTPRFRDCSPISEAGGSSDSQADSKHAKKLGLRLKREEDSGDDMWDVRKGKLKMGISASSRRIEGERGGQKGWGRREKRVRGVKESQAKGEESELPPPPPLKRGSGVAT